MTDAALFALEIRNAATATATDGRERHTIEALCVPYDTPTRLTEHGAEVFARTAFTDLLASPQTWPKIRLVDSHLDTSMRRPVAKAVEFRDEPGGLGATFQFFDTPTGREAWENVAEETYGGVSVGFVALAEGKRGGMREIRSARLHHVALVDEPAYQDAQVVAKRAALSRDAELREYFARPVVRRYVAGVPQNIDGV